MLRAQQITGEDLSIPRRDTLTAGASTALAGAALTEPLQHWLLPITQDTDSTAVGSGFSPTELASLEDLAQDRIGLARTHLISAEPEHACELIHQAISITQPWINGRVGAQLGDFHREAARYADIPMVGDTRDLIHELTAANRWWAKG